MSRGKICYVLLVLSIFFLLSSVCTFAVFAVTKDPITAPQRIEIINDSAPHIEQRRIIKRLKRLEERMNKRNKRKKR
jgi:hypothetical protein|tara:strand:- start:1262 stop:1492 length:231 start_codon:yes stop_codon:yes gene_type:complete